MKKHIIILYIVIVLLCYVLLNACMNWQEYEGMYLEESKINTELEIEKCQLENELKAVTNELNKTEKTLAETAYQLEVSKSYSMEYVGEFKCTAYCCEKYSHICGGSGKTASGKPIQADVSVAVGDLKKLPYGTVIYIEGVGIRIVQDTGDLKKDQIDVAVEKHAQALKWEGQGKHNVYIINIE